MRRLIYSLSILSCVSLTGYTELPGKKQTPLVFQDSGDEEFEDWEDEGETPRDIEPVSRSSFQPKLTQVKPIQLFQLPDSDEIAQADQPAESKEETPDISVEQEGRNKILINFNNVEIIEYIRFVSRLTNQNFIFDEKDLDFTVTVVSEEPTTLENIMTALLQELRIHGLTMIEQGNNLIIHKADNVNSISRVVVDREPQPKESEIVTQVFVLNTLNPSRTADIIRPLTSSRALVEISEETQHLIVTDIVSNVNQIALLLKGIDAPNSGLVIGQYIVRSTAMDTLLQLADKIMAPIVKGQPLTLVPNTTTNVLYIVSTPYLVEKTLSVIERIDQYQGKTEVIDLDKLGKPGDEIDFGDGKAGWDRDMRGNELFRPDFGGRGPSSNEFPKGEWILDPDGNWYFLPEGQEAPFKKEEIKRPQTPILPGEQPRGKWSLDPRGGWIFQLSPGEPVKPEKLTRAAKLAPDLPVGHIDRIQFYTHKLLYRKGEEMLTAIENIAASLQTAEDANQDLVNALNSVQWLESSNTLILTGLPNALGKAKELIDEVDAPLRQVFIEMLILETDLDDSLTYGVDWATRSGGGSTSTAQAYFGAANPLQTSIGTAGVGKTPDASALASAIGYHLGIIGQRLTHGGTQFASLGALVTAEHQRGKSKIILNPKLLTEDNVTAEIFVGINTPYQTDSIVNDEGSIVTTNFEFRDVGTRMLVTPHISNNNDIITLEIEQEFSRDLGTPTSQGGGGTTDQPVGPTTSINRTTTTVHVPDGFFLIMSGMLQEEKIERRNFVPCLGAVPVIGAAFANMDVQDVKRNIMIFIRPVIVDTKEEINTLTKQQQDIYDDSNIRKKSWKYQVDEALEFMNIRRDCCEDCPY